MPTLTLPLLLRTRTADATAPTAAQLAVGEAAFNAVSGKLYIKDSAGTVRVFSDDAATLPATTYVTLAADAAAIASTTLVTVPTLQATVVASGLYEVEWYVWVTVATTTETVGLNVTVPTGAAGNYQALGPLGALTGGAAAAKTGGNPVGTAMASTTFGNLGSATALQPLRVKALVRVGASAGTVALQLNGSTTGAIVVKANSYCQITRIS
jgi:hypothetical protein